MSVDQAQFEQFRQTIEKLGDYAKPIDVSDEERIKRAKAVFRRKLDTIMAADMEACLHCGMCAEVCHFYEGTRDPKYAPVLKYGPLRRFYKRDLGPMRWWYKLVTRDLTIAELEEWQPLVFDSCTECGRCDLMCPMGIQITRLVSIMRQALAAANLAPEELQAVSDEQREKGTVLGVGKDQLEQVVGELRAQGLDVPLDKEKAEIMVLTTVLDLLLFKEALAAIVKIMNKLGVDWTLMSTGFEASNFGMLAGDESGQRTITRRIIDTAIACGAKTVIAPECGQAYPALRWEGANMYGKPLPFEVLAISEFIGQEVKAGRLKVNKAANGKPLTYHDPCNLGRLGGVFEEPRATLKALGADLREMDAHARTNYCCGGGHDVFLINRAAPLRQRAFEIKMREVDETGAQSVVTTCSNCRFNFMNGAANANWNTPVKSLVEMVADNLAN